MEHSRNSSVGRANRSTTASTIHIPNIQKSSTLFNFFYRNSSPRRLLTVKHTDKKKKNASSRAIHSDEAKTGLAEHRNRKEELFSALSKATGLVLSAHQDAASLPPVPYLIEAAGLALGIWNTVQKNNHSAGSSLRTLAEDACKLAYTMWTTWDEVSLCQMQARAAATPQTNVEVEVTTVRGEDGFGNDDTVDPRPFDPDMSGSAPAHGKKAAEQEIEELIPQLETHSMELYSTLDEISDFLTRTASRNVVSRFLTSDASKIEQYQIKLKSVSIRFTSKVTQQNSSRINLVRERAIQKPVQMESIPLHSSAPMLPTTGSLSAEITASSTSLTFGELEESPAPSEPGGSSTTSLGGFSAGGAVFPVTFDFAGATFQTGLPTHKAHHKSTHTTSSDVSQARPQADFEIASQSSAQSGSGSSPGDSNSLNIQGDVTYINGAVVSGGGGYGRSLSSVHTTETELEFEPKSELPCFHFGGSDRNDGGKIQFTSISGDHNTSWVNDQSCGWNFGNTYRYDLNGRKSRREKPINTAALGPNTRKSADGECHGAVRGGQGGLPKDSIAALGKQASGFARNQTQNEQGATYLRDGSMRGQRHPVRGRREANVNYWDPESARDGYYHNQSMTGHGGF